MSVKGDGCWEESWDGCGEMGCLGFWGREIELCPKTWLVSNEGLNRRHHGMMKVHIVILLFVGVVM